MAQTIQHVVVLMLENRGFDHMVGFLKATDPTIDGLTGTESEPVESPPANRSRDRVAQRGVRAEARPSATRSWTRTRNCSAIQTGLHLSPCQTPASSGAIPSAARRRRTRPAS